MTTAKTSGRELGRALAPVIAAASVAALRALADLIEKRV
jgi:hypothetical protein